MKSIHWPTAAQFGFSTFAVVNLWGLAFGVVVLTIIQIVSGEPAAGSLQPLLVGAGLAGIGLALVPSAGYAFLRLIGRPLPGGLSLPGWMRPSLLFLLWPLVLGAGFLASRAGSLAAWVLPFLHVLAVGLPVSWLVFLAVRDLPVGSAQRRWGLFACGAALGPLLAFLIEALLLLGAILVWSVWLAFRPDVMQEMTVLAERIQRAAADPILLQHILEPYLNRPAVWVGILVYTGLLVPLVEEMIKPVGVWFFARRGLTPVQGWTAGVLSGAGFAFAESLMLAGRMDDWSILVVARVGTAVVHTLTAGLVGWGLAGAWSHGRHLRLAAAYLSAVSIHAVWNSLTIASTAASLTGPEAGFLPDWALQAARTFPYILGGLGFAGLFVLVAANQGFIRSFQKVKNGVD